MFKNPVYYRTSAFLFLISFLLVFVISGFNLLRFVNTLFLTGLTLLMIGSVALIIQSGFFTVFISGFRKIMQSQEEVYSEPESSKSSNKKQSSWTQWISPVCLTVGLIHTLLSYLLLL